MEKVFIIVNSLGQAQTIQVPGAAGTFSIAPVFLDLKDAQLCLEALPAGPERMIVEARVFVERCLQTRNE